MTLPLAAATALLALAVIRVFAILYVWGWNIRLTVPGGLLQALCQDDVVRTDGTFAIIGEHEHYDGVRIMPWGAVVWLAVEDRTIGLDNPSRAYTLIPRGTKAYRVLRRYVQRVPTRAEWSRRA